MERLLVIFGVGTAFAMTPPQLLLPLTTTERATDVSGSAVPTVEGSMLDFTSVTGSAQVSEAASFTGSANSYIKIDKTGGAIDVDRSFSLAGYFKRRDASGGGPLGSYYDYVNNIHDFGIKVQLHVGSDTVDLTLDDRDTADKVTLNSGSGFMPFDTWVFLVVSYDYCTGEVSFWKNGKLWKRHQVDSFRQETFRDVYLGSCGSGPSFRGMVSCYQVYDYALSGTQVARAKGMAEAGCNLGMLLDPPDIITIATFDRLLHAWSMDHAALESTEKRSPLQCSLQCQRSPLCVTYQIRPTAGYFLCELFEVCPNEVALLPDNGVTIYRKIN